MGRSGGLRRAGGRRKKGNCASKKRGNEKNGCTTLRIASADETRKRLATLNKWTATEARMGLAGVESKDRVWAFR